MKERQYMNFNYNALRKKIKQEFKTFGAFAIAMGVPYQRMSRLLTGKAEWKRDEMYLAADLLNIMDELKEYFFTIESHK